LGPLWPALLLRSDEGPNTGPDGEATIQINAGLTEVVAPLFGAHAKCIDYSLTEAKSAITLFVPVYSIFY
jgi:hypothetical protein